MILIFATHNHNKAREVQAALPVGFEVKTLDDIGFVDEIPETGKTLEANALIKARALFEAHHVDCFADDTGLEVEALDGEPGVYSARYAGESANAENNISKLLEALKDSSNRKARFRTVFALILAGNEYLFEGIVEGSITKEKKGASGFGYDPVFQPDGYIATFAEMSMEEKNAISHRAIALIKMAEFIKERLTIKVFNTQK